MLPYLQPEFKANPASYFAHLVGHEGENSLLSYLKKEDFAMGLTVDSDTQLNCFSSFIVKIALTKKGLENHEKVL